MTSSCLIHGVSTSQGASGSWYTSSPGTGINVISVASLDKCVFFVYGVYCHAKFCDSTVIPLQNATVGGVAHPPITYFQTFPLPFSTVFPIYATSNDTSVVDDACNPLAPSVPDLSNFLVIVRRGTCSFVSRLFLCFITYPNQPCTSGPENYQHCCQRCKSSAYLRVSEPRLHDEADSDGPPTVTGVVLLVSQSGISPQL